MMLVSTVITGCSVGDAFVDRNYMTSGVRKQKLPGFDGNVTVCYGGDTPREKRDELAREACDVYGLQPLLIQEAKWQCRLTVPHSASYACINPEMRIPGGGYINPFSASQVEIWRQAKDRTTAGQPAEDDSAR